MYQLLKQLSRLKNYNKMKLLIVAVAVLVSSAHGRFLYPAASVPVVQYSVPAAYPVAPAVVSAPVTKTYVQAATVPVVQYVRPLTPVTTTYKLLIVALAVLVSSAHGRFLYSAASVPVVRYSVPAAVQVAPSVVTAPVTKTYVQAATVPVVQYVRPLTPVTTTYVRPATYYTRTDYLRQK
ncbi:cuticle protein 16.5-like [Musca vetustissima]|uniref:cuticle protein 16.5-like n=1 Tax=Musca vetustissima TaxID=27455 RepID=UPI002AB64602|nr:cuticle protein 16.5-like [Musca vetustissima]